MSDKQYKFQKLTPVSNIKMDVYENAMDYALSCKDIRNIAISGPYCAGKSSMIESYKSRHKEKRFIHISMAHFEEISDTPSDDNKAIDTILEGKILNQLIHQLDPKDIPQTIFKVKRKVEKKDIFFSAASISLLMIFLLYLRFYNEWCLLFNKLSSESVVYKVLQFSTKIETVFIVGLLSFTILLLAIYILINAQKNKKLLKRLNVQGNEIEVFGDADDSYFDKYLNEVLYLFENTNVDAIVFEDMDRFNENKIFEKLREINALVNNKHRKTNNDSLHFSEPLRFFYLLRDDIFITKDRTKFFDFIIPIVPVIDGSNSYDIFIEYFKDGGIFELFEEDFIQSLSLYIDDMRILKNIYNEFVIYYNRFLMTSTEQNENKLLAMIVYKNIFPRDFNDLHLSRGFVHTLFNKKNEFIENEVNRLQKEIDKLHRMNEEINNQHLNDLDELDAIYVVFDKKRIKVGNREEIDFKTRIELIKAMKENPHTVQYYDQNYGWTNLDIENYFATFQNNPEYFRKKALINDLLNGKIESNSIIIRELKERQEMVRNGYIKNIINRENIDEIFKSTYVNEIGDEEKFEEIKSSYYFSLIKFLIRKGYIDETYPDYMTYFYENSLSRNDKIFLRSVTDEEAKDYSYKLTNPLLVVSRLRVVDYDATETLNFDLLIFLIKNEAIYNKQLNRFLNRIISTKPERFVNEFLSLGVEKDIFINKMNLIWDSMCKWIIEEVEFSNQQKIDYIINTFYFSSKEVIVRNNNEGVMSKFIHNCIDFLAVSDPDIDKIIKGLFALDAKFNYIDYEKSDKELFDAVYKANLYELNLRMINLILVTKYNMDNSNDFNTKNYTLILSKPAEPLNNYISKNINEYIKLIIDECGSNINDSCEVATNVINNEDVEEDLKVEYINLMNTQIHDINKITSKIFWKQIFDKRKINENKDNILSYFIRSNMGLDDTLIETINGTSVRLDFSYREIDQKYGEDSSSKFFDSIVICNTLINEKYNEILTALTYKYNIFNILGINRDKIDILISNGVIKMTINSLIFMRSNYTENLMNYIVKNIEKYTNEIISSDNYSSDEMINLLDIDIPDKFKITLMKNEENSISVINKNYSDNVIRYILYNNLEIRDIPYLLKRYSKSKTIVQNAILEIAIRHIEVIKNEQYSMDLKLLSDVINSDSVSSNNKIELFANCVPDMNSNVVSIGFLRRLNMDNYISLFEGRRPRFEANELNNRLLSSFEKHGWITKFDFDKDDSNFYRAIGRKQRTK